MAIGIQNYPNIDTTNPTAYPNGATKDDPAGISGTPVKTQTLGDYVQTFDKLLRLAAVTANNTPDNETNGYQYITALQALANNQIFPLTDGLAGIVSQFTGSITSGSPYIISGMNEVNIPFIQLKHGWLYYNGQFIEFLDSAIPTPIGSNVILVQIGAPKGVRQASLIQGPSVTNSTMFPLSILQPFGRENAFKTLSASGPATGTISYRKNYLANTIQLKGTLTVTASAVNGTVIYTGSNSPTGPIYFVAAMLPTGYFPVSSTVQFTANVRVFENFFLDDVGHALTNINAEVQTDGSISFGWRKPSSGITTYQVSFNAVIPLD